MGFTTDHDLFRESVKHFVATEILPHDDRWEREGKVDKDMFVRAGKAGLLGMAVPVSYGGGGVDDFRFNAIIDEEVVASGAGAAGMCITLHNDICLPYFLAYGTDAQKQRWLPGFVDGTLMTAIAMTEPGTGSDLAGIATTARREGDAYVVNG